MKEDSLSNQCVNIHLIPIFNRIYSYPQLFQCPPIQRPTILPSKSSAKVGETQSFGITEKGRSRDLPRQFASNPSYCSYTSFIPYSKRNLIPQMLGLLITVSHFFPPPALSGLLRHDLFMSYVSYVQKFCSISSILLILLDIDALFKKPL